MKKIIKFKENIFKKEKNPLFINKYELEDSQIMIQKFKKDLLQIQRSLIENQYESLEVILTHIKKLPPKTSRCVEDILRINDSVSYSTARFSNIEKDNVELEIILNFKKEGIEKIINYTEAIIDLMNLFKKNNVSIATLKKTKENYPIWLQEYLKTSSHFKNIGKTKKFISSIQQHYKKLKLSQPELTKKGELIVSFSSQAVQKEFLKKNNITKSQYKTLGTGWDQMNKIVINQNLIIDSHNILTWSPNYKVPGIKQNVEWENNETRYEFEASVATNAIIGVLDSCIQENSSFKNLIKVTSLVDKRDSYDHGEMVSTLIYDGDKINDFDDGCGPFNIHLFEIYEKGINVVNLFKRIDFAIKTNLHIKVWNLSINNAFEEVSNSGQITELASWLDLIQKKYDVIIVQSAGNANKEERNIEHILSPGDSVRSLVVNSTNALESHFPSSYSLKGTNEYSAQKPDLAFFGGDNQNPIKVCLNHKIYKDMGTSFATPLVVRKIAQLVYYEHKSLLEAKALLIHAAYVNSQNQKQNTKNGWGVLPNHIKNILNTNNDAIRFVFKEKIEDTKTAFQDLKIPQTHTQEYSVLLTCLSSEDLNINYGCEYVRSSVQLSMGQHQDGQFIPSRKIKFNDNATLEKQDIKIFEKDLIKLYAKWKTVYCGKDIIKGRRKSNNNTGQYLIKTTINKRMDIIKEHKIHDLICIVTLIHKDGQDKYQQFINENKMYIDLQTRLELEGEIPLT